MTTSHSPDSWSHFLTYVKKHCSKAAYGNWLAPIQCVKCTAEEVVLEIPNIFVKEYLLSNYKKELCSFLPVKTNGDPAVEFIVASPKAAAKPTSQPTSNEIKTQSREQQRPRIPLNPRYRFETYVEGPSNQFVKSAALGVAARPGKSYNPLFIHGGVGLGKTHILHSIGHLVQEGQKNLQVQCITTEAFINDLVESLRNKSVDKMKRFYRADVDVLLVDDIQFLQNRLNFEEELCHTFETLINQGKQIVITSDKPPAQLKLSERMIARMEWGLVAHLATPDLETRVAILLNKAEQKGLEIPNNIAFYIAEHIYNNVRQLEGAVNRLSAQCRLMDLSITQDLVESSLKEMLQQIPQTQVTVDQILKTVASVFGVRMTDLRGSGRTKEIALPRQVAMYLAHKLLNESLQVIGASFGKTHSTILHACKSVEKKLTEDEMLRRQLGMIERNVATK